AHPRPGEPRSGPELHARHRALRRPGGRRTQWRAAARRAAGTGAAHLSRRARGHLRPRRRGPRHEAARQALMRVVTDLGQVGRSPRALAIGTFDGVHAGHRAVISKAVELAREGGLRSAAVTFDRHPLAVVDPARMPRLLTPPAEKIRLIGELAPDELVLLPFD